jgi:hypothetical protein
MESYRPSGVTIEAMDTIVRMIVCAYPVIVSLLCTPDTAAVLEPRMLGHRVEWRKRESTFLSQISLMWDTGRWM